MPEPCSHRVDIDAGAEIPKRRDALGPLGLGSDRDVKGTPAEDEFNFLATCERRSRVLLSNMPIRWIFVAVAATCALPHPVRCIQFSVSPSVQVSGAHPADMHYEVCAAIDPRNPLRLIAASFRYAPEGRTRTVIYASTDGGKTWRASLDS